MSAGARLARVILAGLLGLVSGLAFGPVFGGTPGPFLAAVGATVATAVVAAMIPRIGPALVAVGGMTAVVVVAAVVTGAGTAMTHGPWRLLTGALPVDPAGPPLAAVAVVVGWTTLVGCLLAAHATAVFAPVFPALACLLAALALGASGAPLPGWHAAVTAALIVALLATGQRTRPSPGALAMVALTGGIVVLATALIGPVTPGAQAGEPADARALVAAPVVPKSGVSPLQKYLAWRDGSVPLKLTGTTSRPGSPLKLATLTSFDGAYWTVSGDYRLAGTRLPPPPEEGRPATVTQRVRVDAGNLEWLVAAGHATRISVGGMGIDEATGDVVVPAGKPSPAAYEATSVLNRVTLADARGADPARGALAVPLPIPIRGFVERTVAGRAPGYEQLAALHERLAGGRDFRYDEAQQVAGGHGYYQILRLLLKTRRGTSEQYASAYAVMARHLGMDARVVVGFRPRARGGAFEVTGRDVDAWVEVRFTGLGWVAIDPSPRHNPIGTRMDAPKTTKQQYSPPPQEDHAQSERSSPPRSASRGTDPTGTTPGPDRRLFVASLIATGMLVLLLAIPAAKAIRRTRRRRDRSPRRSALGAWWETLDRLLEAGIPVGPALTTGEVVRLASGIPEIRSLAEVIDQAAYAPEEPSPDLLARAWAYATTVERRLRGGMPWPRRLAASFDPRPLVRHRLGASFAVKLPTPTHLLSDRPAGNGQPEPPGSGEGQPVMTLAGGQGNDRSCIT